MIMSGTTIAGTISESELANVRTPLQLTDRVFITVGSVTYKGTLANVLAYISANIDLSAYVTTASIVNVLTSTATNAPVSAAQAKALKDLIDSLTTAVGLKLDSSAYVQHYKGKYTSLGGLQTAYPTATDGDYAIVDAGSGTNAIEYIWDANEGWVDTGGVRVGTTTDQITEGSTNKYFTDIRVRDVVLTGLSLATNAAITATDSVLTAFGKLQKQITDLTTSLSSYLTTSAAGTTYATIANQRYSFNPQSGTTYTIALADVTASGHVIVELSNGSFTDCTVPTPTSLGVTAGDSVNVSITGAYAAQKLLAGSGATLTGNALFSFQYETKTLIAKDSTTWKIVGG